MQFQDIIFSTGSIIFIISMIPMLKAAGKPPLSTSLPTGGVLLVYALACYTTLGLWYSFGTGLLLASLWLYAGYQRWKEIHV